MTPLSNSLRRLAVLTAIVATVAAVVATMTPTSTARAAQASDTSATLTYSGTALRVKVDSPKAACERGRRVFIVARAGSAPSGAGVGKTDGNGVFRIPTGPPPEDLTALAYVARTPSCRLAQSSPISIDGVPPRAAAKARTGVRLTYTGTALRVKVSSPKAACVKGRKIDLIIFQNGAEFGFSLGGKSNNQGVYQQTLSGRGEPPTRIVAFARTTAGCNVGQSRIVNAAPSAP